TNPVTRPYPTAAEIDGWSLPEQGPNRTVRYLGKKASDEKDKKQCENLADSKREAGLLTVVIDDLSDPGEDEKNGPVASCHKPEVRSNSEIPQQQDQSQGSPDQASEKGWTACY